MASFTKIGGLIALFTLLLGGLVGANPQPAHILNYSVITLGSSWSSIRSNYVDQMINISESSFSPYINYNDNFANFEYFYCSNATIIPAWIEINNSGTLITWVNISNKTALDNICLGFASKSYNLLGSGIGEAPELSTTYAEYDNGNTVFVNYWNFAGSSAPTKWVESPSSGTVTVSNGLLIKSTSGWVNLWSAGNYPINPATDTMDQYSYQTSSGGGQEGLIDGVGGVSQSNGVWNDYYSGRTSYTQLGTLSGGGSTYTSTSQTQSHTTPSVSSVWIYGNSAYLSIGYGTPTSTTTDVTSSTTLSFVFGASVSGQSVYVQWTRSRVTPPSSTMPSALFGSITHTTSTTSTTTSTTSTTTIPAYVEPSNLINATTGIHNIAYIFTYTLGLGQMGIMGLLLLIAGIAYQRSGKTRIALLFAWMLSLILYVLAPSLTGIYIPIILSSLLGFVIISDNHARRTNVW